MLLVDRKAVDFCVLTLYIANLDPFPNFNNLYVDYFGFSIFSIISFPNNDIIFSFFMILILQG